MKRKLIVAASIIAAPLFLSVCTSIHRNMHTGDMKMAIESSPNYRQNKFVCLDGDKPVFSGSRFDAMYAFLKGGENRTPAEPLESAALTTDLKSGIKPEGLSVTWLGHSSMVLQMEGMRILIDPMFSWRSSPVQFAGPKRFSKAIPVAPEDIKNVDIVIISHDHYDHLDYDTIMGIHKECARFIVPLGVGAYLEKWGVPKDKITELDWWQETRIRNTITITAAPAQHFSGRSPFKSNDTLWASWSIAGAKYKVFYSGDSGYNSHFKEIGKRLGPFDLAMMEDGQYNQSWERVHMMPEQTVQAFQDVRGKVLMPVHWGAFTLSVHTWDDPAERAVKAAESKNLAIVTPRIGQTWNFDSERPVERWWRNFAADTSIQGKENV